MGFSTVPVKLPKDLPLGTHSVQHSPESLVSEQTTQKSIPVDSNDPPSGYMPGLEHRKEGGGGLPQLQVAGRVKDAEAEYSKWAEAYDKDTASYGWCAPAKLLEWATGAVPTKSHVRVLDVGVGTGQASEPYLGAGAQVTGLDISQEMLRQARAEHPTFHHLGVYDINEPLSSTGVQPESYTLIMSSGTLHFARDLGASIGYLAEGLEPGGALAFTYVPTQAREFSSKTTPRDMAEVEAMIAAAGLELQGHETFVAYHDKGNPDDPVLYARVLAKKTGQPREIPKPLQGLDRTACVDRNAVQQAFGTPPVHGPVGLQVVESGAHATDLLAALEAQVASGKIDPHALALPTTVSPLALQGEPGADVLALLAHPDDEAVYMGGTLAALNDDGASVRLVHSTGGDGGRGAKGDEAIEKTRAREQARALAMLGMTTKAFTQLGFADFGKYRDNTHRSEPATAADTLRIWGATKLIEGLVRQIRTERPRVVVSFDSSKDPNYSLHGHHLAMGVAAMVAYHLAADPNAFPEQLEAGLAPWAAEAHYTVLPHHEQTGRSRRVPIDAERKLGTLRAHESQTYSTERLMDALEKKEPNKIVENWHLLQARAENVAVDPLSQIQRKGEP